MSTRWLYYQVHGVFPPRRSPRRRTGRGPARSWKYKQWVRSLPCVACGIEGRSEAAHTGSDGGLRQKSSDYSCVPLCPDCHTMGIESYHQVGREGFEQACGLDFSQTVRTLNRLWFQYSKEVK